jgi:cytoskeletal protein RodZ
MGIPVWGWAVGGGVLVGLVYIVWRQRQTAVASTTDTTGTGTAATTILPMDQGLAQQQVDSIVAAIRDQLGPPSTTTTPPTTTAPGALVQVTVPKLSAAQNNWTYVGKYFGTTMAELQKLNPSVAHAKSLSGLTLLVPAATAPSYAHGKAVTA